MRLPTINDAMRLSKAGRLKRCVVLFETDDGRVGYCSYGETRALCAATRDLMEEMFPAIERRIHGVDDHPTCREQDLAEIERLKLKLKAKAGRNYLEAMGATEHE